jgi:hypothetical protein
VVGVVGGGEVVSWLVVRWPLFWVDVTYLPDSTLTVIRRDKERTAASRGALLTAAMARHRCSEIYTLRQERRLHSSIHNVHGCRCCPWPRATGTGDWRGGATSRCRDRMGTIVGWTMPSTNYHDQSRPWHHLGVPECCSESACRRRCRSSSSSTARCWWEWEDYQPYPRPWNCAMKPELQNAIGPFPQTRQPRPRRP